MSTLSEQERAETSAKYNREFDEETSLLKSEVRILIDSADDLLDTLPSTYNPLIPQPVRSKATVKEKVRALVHVLNTRFKLGV